MAKATIAVAVLAVALLLTGPAAAEANRKLKQAAASSNSGGFTTGSPLFSQAGAFDQAATFSNPFASAGAAGGAGYSVAINKDGQPSISTSVGEGTTESFAGQSSSQAQSTSTNNGIPGTGAFNNIDVASANGKVATEAIAKSLAQG